MDQPSSQSNIIKESDAAFLLKLLILSFSGGPSRSLHCSDDDGVFEARWDSEM